MEQNTAPQGEQAALPPENNNSPKGDAPQSSSEQDGLKLLAGKFKAVPDLEKSYQEAQRELTKAKQELAEYKKSKPETKADAPVADEKPVKETVEQKKARVGESLMAEYIEKGSLSEATRIKAVEELGLPAQVVADFEHFLAKKVETGLQKIKATFSEFGDFDINAVIDEMNTTLPPERLNAIKTLVDAGDIEVLRPYIKNHVKAKLPEAQVGRAGGSGAGGFKDKAEMRKAMLSPKFGTDKAYTEEFWARNAASAENVRLVR